MKTTAPITGPQKLTRPPPIEHHHHDEARPVQAHHVGVGATAAPWRTVRPRAPRLRAEMREGHPLVEPHVVADEGGARLVLLDRAAAPCRTANARAATANDDDDREDGEDEVEQGHVVCEVEGDEARASARQPLDVEQPVLAAGDASAT